MKNKTIIAALWYIDNSYSAKYSDTLSSASEFLREAGEDPEAEFTIVVAEPES